MKNAILALLFISILSACSSSDDNSLWDQAQEPLDESFMGVWMLDEQNQILVSETSITVLSMDPNRSCYEYSAYNVVHSTANATISEDVKTGEQTESHFERNGELLEVTESGETLSFYPPEFIFRATPSCESSEITVELTFAELPEQILVERSELDNWYMEYKYAIDFDVNRNGISDAGDVALTLYSIKGSSSNPYSGNSFISMEELHSQLWRYQNRQAENKVVTSSISDWNFDVTHNSNTLTFMAYSEQLPLLSLVDENTPFRVTAVINYPNPSSEVENQNVDGPWNWSSDIHADHYPDEGFSSTTAETLHVDQVEDHAEGEAKMVDITTVRLRFN